jgi:glycosyltransferase involved in cell wall biosynthesis
MSETKAGPSIPPETSLMSPGDVASYQGADVVVLLPTLNEEEGLARTLDEIPFDNLRSLGWTVRPLVVDGPSTDRTREVAHSRGVPVLLQQNRGKGSAIRQALDWLAQRQVRFVIVLDADCTYPGNMVPAFAQLLDAGSQLVVGIRQPVRPANHDGRELVHRVGNRLLNVTASQLSGLPILDLCSGFWGVRLDVVAGLHLETDGFEIESELFSKAYRAGFNVSQIPISYRERVGVAKLRALHDGARILLTTVRFGRRGIRSGFTLPKPLAVRDLLSVVMVHGATDFVVFFDATRKSEAEQIADRIRAGAPGSRVSVRPTPPASPAVTPTLPYSTGADAGRAVTIRLPTLDGIAANGGAYAILDLPSTHRVVTLAPPSDLRASRSGAFGGAGDLRLEYAPFRWPAVDRVKALLANTFPSGEAKELAFLGANGHYGTLAVWHRPRETASPERIDSPTGAPSHVTGGRVSSDDAL